MVEAKKKGYDMALTAEESDKKFRETLWYLGNPGDRRTYKQALLHLLWAMYSLIVARIAYIMQLNCLSYWYKTN